MPTTLSASSTTGTALMRWAPNRLTTVLNGVLGLAVTTFVVIMSRTSR
jgi:hypothetical protein